MTMDGNSVDDDVNVAPPGDLWLNGLDAETYALLLRGEAAFLW